MTCCGGGIEVPEEERRQNAQIQKDLASDKKVLEQSVKILLLGAGESGKSTIAKQMKIIHLDGFTDEERLSWRATVHSNAFQCLRTILKGAEDLGINVKGKNARKLARVVVSDESYFSGTITTEMASELATIWADPGVRIAFDRRAEYQLPDCADYYLDKIVSLGEPDYVPTPDDILRARQKTTGVLETEWVQEGVNFKMVDVGGQRSERKKWMHCFSEVTAVLFCAALNDYDLKLYEDNETNRMTESLKLFKEICNSHWFRDTAMILFLNKSDLFREKIKRVSIKTYFKNYDGPEKDYKSCVAYVTDQFTRLNESTSKPIYPHITCATDTNATRVVFTAVRDIVLQTALQKAGLTSVNV